VEIWQPVASGRSLEFIAKHGIKGMLALNGEKLTEQIMHRYQELNAKYGRDLELGEDICLGMGFCIADSQQKAIDKVRPYHDERYKWFAPFGFVRYTDEQGRPWGTPGAPARLPSIEDGVQQKAWLCGPPEHLIAQLREIEAKYPGLEHVMFHWPEGMPLQEFKEQLRRLGKEVMPAFTQTSTA
jgi:alkanesulfonate monooxygenase SsuD/methylene tetrahydromethanopterin reductase-like flavin-dependent oxidoreductase (luciferase family)